MGTKNSLAPTSIFSEASPGVYRGDSDLKFLILVLLISGLFLLYSWSSNGLHLAESLCFSCGYSTLKGSSNGLHLAESFCFSCDCSTLKGSGL